MRRAGARAETGSGAALPAAQAAVAGLAALAIAVLALSLGHESWRRGALVLIGAGLGLALYHGAFGFTSAWRRAIAERDMAGARAQVAMIAAAVMLFAPVLAAGTAFGVPVTGALAPVGLAVPIGAFAFGLGMQLAGGCGSGTLFTVGGGSVRMVATLVAFCLGGFLATLDFGFWLGLPGLGTVALDRVLGWDGALGVSLGVLAVAWVALGRMHRAGAASVGASAGTDRAGRWLRGPWPLAAAALALAGLNLATLLVAGHPWSITWGFTLWGAKAAAALGWDPAASAFWSAGFPARAFGGSLLDDTTSLMNIAILIGAALAAGLAARFRPGLAMAPGALMGALVGGLLMGYGARLAFGCNIGAFFSGVASQSLHGWVWIAAALPGAWLGVRLRPWFGYADVRTRASGAPIEDGPDRGPETA